MGTSKPAAVVGSGPNGLAAAVTLARAGVPVTVFEAAEIIGGGARTAEVVRPGILHDVCSAIHPMAISTGFFRAFELTKRMEFVVPEASYAHPLDGPGSEAQAAVAYRSLDRTAAELGRDGEAYARYYRPLLKRLEGLLKFALGPTMLRVPRDVPAAIWAGLRAAEQGGPLWNARFHGEAAPALFSGVAAHSIARMPNLATAAAGVVLGALGHAGGWPVAVGGSHSIVDALAQDLRKHGGEILTGRAISDVRELSEYGVKVFDTSARGLAAIAGAELPGGYRRKLERFQFGDGVTKVDFVLDGPIPWADPRVAEAATVHVGGTRAEVAAAEREVSRGRHPSRPYVLVAQPDGFDTSRNPRGVHAIWSYTHVPAGSDVDVSERVIRQIERFAPGFRDRITAMHMRTAAELQRYNANYVGGDISAGAINLRQLLARPTLSTHPHRTPAPGLYLASSSAAPGPGVHGLSGWYAARSALRFEYGLPDPDLSIEGE